MDSITVNAYAKINLGLDVLRRREDGYHDICSIMQSLMLHDTLTVKKKASKEITIHTNDPSLPVDQSNLVYKAAALFLDTISVSEGLDITLEKTIPIAAGLAGGSSDAAAVLKGLNVLYETAVPGEELMRLGKMIGADVPYCLLLGTALSEGIGERLTPLPPMPDCFILLVKPSVSVSTKYVYENLNLSGSVIHPDISTMLECLRAGDLTGLAGSMDNILQTVTIREYPVIDEIKKKMLGQGALTSLMSGSGPTVFGIFQDKEAAESAFRYFIDNPAYGNQIYLTKPFQPER